MLDETNVHRLRPSSQTFVNTGALGRTRTANPLIRSQMLYPLSYERLSPHISGELNV